MNYLKIISKTKHNDLHLSFFKKKASLTHNAFFSKVRKMPIPGTHGVTAYDIVTTFIKSIKDIRLTERAAAISFNFLMAIPATLIFLFSLVPFLPLHAAHEAVLNSIRLLSPNPKLYASLESIITDFMNNKRRELLSFGFLFTVFVSSNGVMGILRSFDRDSPVQIKRTGIARRWKAFLLTLGLMPVLLISLSIIIIQTSVIDKFLLDHFGSTLAIKLLSILTLLVIIYFSICILYKYGPSLHQQLPFFSTGAFLASVLFILISSVFFFIANHFVNYNKVYGSIGTLLMFMIWMFITGMVILIGYEINLLILVFPDKLKGANNPGDKHFPKR
jgi:membrane protein